MFEASFGGHGVRLTLRVDRYESPHIETGWDANWLVAEAELDAGLVGRFHAKHRISILTTDLEKLRDELRLLDDALSGEAVLASMEEEIELTIRADAGKLKLSGHLRESGFGPELCFENIDTDPTFVRAALTQVEEIVRAFPPRGKTPRAAPPD